jgi:hypothetical protein
LASKESATNIGFLMPPILSAVSHFLAKCKVKALKTLEESFSLFTVLVADPATGKSPAMNLIRNILIDIEEFDGISEEDSPQTTQATVEALIHYMKKNGSFIIFFLVLNLL